MTPAARSLAAALRELGATTPARAVTDAQLARAIDVPHRQVADLAGELLAAGVLVVASTGEPAGRFVIEPGADLSPALEYLDVLRGRAIAVLTRRAAVKRIIAARQGRQRDLFAPAANAADAHADAADVDGLDVEPDVERAERRGNPCRTVTTPSRSARQVASSTDAADTPDTIRREAESAAAARELSAIRRRWAALPPPLRAELLERAIADMPEFLRPQRHAERPSTADELSHVWAARVAKFMPPLKGAPEMPPEQAAPIPTPMLLDNVASLLEPFASPRRLSVPAADVTEPATDEGRAALRVRPPRLATVLPAAEILS